MGTPVSKIDDGCTRGELENSGLTVTNIVATVDLEREFDLAELAKSIPETDYDPEISPFALFRTDAATVMIPRTGKLSIVGASEVQDISDTLTSFLESFDRTQIKINIPEPQIQNIVVNGGFNREIMLEPLVLELGMERTEYEPEQFPGIIHRVGENATVLLFKSGTFVITGVTNYSETCRVSTIFKEELNGLFQDI
jgi:transcription initiation factor TFIID TATA-box-binding protein